MAVPMTPEFEKRLNDLAARTGLAPERLLEEALAGYDAGRMAALDWSRCSAVERVPGKVGGAWVPLRPFLTRHSVSNGRRVASIQQTQRYLNVTDEELRKGLEVSWINQGRPLRAVSGS